MQHNHLAVITLAAGKGTRMQSHLPKCLHKIAHRPMVLHALNAAQKLEPEHLICIVGEGQEDLEKVVNDYGVQTIIQTDRLGTGHAVLQAKETLKNFNGIILVTYGDTPMITPDTLSALVEALEKNKKAMISVLGFYTDEPGNYGRLILNDDNELVAIVEAKDASPDELLVDFVNSGFMALRSPQCWNILDQLSNDNAAGEYYLTETVSIADLEGSVSVAVEGYADELYGVNTRVELAYLEQLEQNRLREYHMLNGVTLLDPSQVYFSYDTIIGKDVTIEPNVYFAENVTIGDNCHIRASSHFEGATVGNGCNIGPFARLRPGAEIGNGCNIGNFVEIKKSKVKDGAKVNHLTYIGDAIIGERTNVGAGTITCNYDGFFKYGTNIGADVFVGSNTAFVAPVTIGDGATTGAGSVITADVAPDSLALTRPERRDVEGWSAKFRTKQKAKKEAAKK